MRSIAAALAVTLCAAVINEGRGTTICQATDAWICPSGTCECAATLNNGYNDSLYGTSCRGPMIRNNYTTCECDDSCVCNGVVQSVQVSDPVPKCNALSTKTKCHDHCKMEFNSFDMAGTGVNWRNYNHNTGRCVCITCTENVLVCEGFDDDDDADPLRPPSDPAPTSTSHDMSTNMVLSLMVVLINAVAVASMTLF
mmetsp:Transcript_13524/g.22112  ORF Transcript_13524/g.22112 Transcript_13524/m.22112 type:complete len:197 (+) Transcript_13524:132-722(+)